MCVGEFVCQSKSSATVCVCPVVVQCYCSMEPTPTSATPTASPPWTWQNPPLRPCSQVSFLPVLRLKTHFSVSVFLSVLLCRLCVFVYIFSVSCLLFSLLLPSPLSLHISTAASTFTFCPQLSNHHPFPHFVEGCRRHQLFFLSIYHPLILQGCAAHVLTALVIQSSLPRLYAHWSLHHVFCSAALISGQKCLALCFLF